MKQSSLRYLGLFDLLLLAALVAAFGVGAVATHPLAWALALAGLFALLAGSVAALSVGPAVVTWRHLAGLAYACFAVAWPLTYGPAVVAGTATTEDLLLFVVTTAGALTLLFVGFDLARDGRHFDVDADVETVVGR